LDSAAETDKDIAKDKQLPPIGWFWQLVPKKLVDKCADEPWAGHFSGSLYELILMIQTFNKEAKPNSDQKKMYAGIASSFLIATGMHTAVEVVYVVKNYLGTEVKPPSKDKLAETVCSGATTYMSGIISGMQ